MLDWAERKEAVRRFVVPTMHVSGRCATIPRSSPGLPAPSQKAAQRTAPRLLEMPVIPRSAPVPGLPPPPRTPISCPRARLRALRTYSAAQDRIPQLYPAEPPRLPGAPPPDRSGDARRRLPATDERPEHFLHDGVRRPLNGCNRLDGLIHRHPPRLQSTGRHPKVSRTFCRQRRLVHVHACNAPNYEWSQPNAISSHPIPHRAMRVKGVLVRGKPLEREPAAGSLPADSERVRCQAYMARRSCGRLRKT